MAMYKNGERLFVATTEEDSQLKHGFLQNESVQIDQIIEEGTKYEYYRAKSLQRSKETYFVKEQDLTKTQLEVEDNA